MRRHALQRPFRGVRSYGLDLESLDDRCLAYSARMPSEAAFSHTTAARLWAMPLPAAVADEIHVTVPIPRRAPAVSGVVGHQQRFEQSERFTLRGLTIASPAATWAQLGEILSVEDLIAVGEHISTGNPYERRLPLAEVDDLDAAISVRLRGPGHRVRLAAAAEMCEGAFSRPESFVRLLLVRCGLPDPVVNGEVCGERGQFLAMPDLQWPEFKVALEYQGDHHRGQAQFRRDIARIEKLIDAGWLVVQVSASELFGTPEVVVRRAAHRLASRGWSGRIHLRRLTTFVS